MEDPRFCCLGCMGTGMLKSFQLRSANIGAVEPYAGNPSFQKSRCNHFHGLEFKFYWCILLDTSITTTSCNYRNYS